MATQDFSGDDIVKVLQKFGFRHDRTRGSHAVLKYTHPETGEKRTVTVPLHDRVRLGTLQRIADQCGANDFHAWCEWIDEYRYRRDVNPAANLVPECSLVDRYPQKKLPLTHSLRVGLKGAGRSPAETTVPRAQRAGRSERRQALASQAPQRASDACGASE